MATTDQGSEDPGRGLCDEREDLHSIVEELRDLVRAFGATPPDRMTPHFYVHAFNEYDIAIRALLDALDVRRSGDQAQ